MRLGNARSAISNSATASRRFPMRAGIEPMVSVISGLLERRRAASASCSARGRSGFSARTIMQARLFNTIGNWGLL